MGILKKIQQSFKKDNYPIANGTFIQPDMVIKWDDTMWQKELKYLKEIKMDYIIMNTFIASKDVVKRVYNTKIKKESMEGSFDVVDRLLKNCEKNGIKVFLGIDYDSKWWEKGPRDPKWLYNQMKKGNLIAEELYKNYHKKYPNAFYGWYWVYEVDNLNFKTKKDFLILAKAVNINLMYLKDNNMRLPFMMSPFMNSKFCTPRCYAANWAYFFQIANLKKGDIFCPQDSVGGGGLNIKQVRRWFSALSKAVKTKSGLLFWANVETFDHVNWYSATLKRFVYQMKIEKPFVENIITFAYSHYYSPNNIDEGFHNNYLQYIDEGKIKKSEPEFPKVVKVKKINDDKFLIKWSQRKKHSQIAGYKVYCNGKEVYFAMVQRKYGGNVNISLNEFTHNTKLKKPKYEVRACDFWGNLSKYKQAEWVE